VCIEDVNGDTALHAAARLGEAQVLWLVLVHAAAEEKRKGLEGGRGEGSNIKNWREEEGLSEEKGDNYKKR